MFQFIIGFLSALVLIQFYPPAAKIGEWIVAKGRKIVSGA